MPNIPDDIEKWLVKFAAKMRKEHDLFLCTEWYRGFGNAYLAGFDMTILKGATKVVMVVPQTGHVTVYKYEEGFHVNLDEETAN